jgi:hypothetical protein
MAGTGMCWRLADEDELQAAAAAAAAEALDERRLCLYKICACQLTIGAVTESSCSLAATNPGGLM